jgi:hypothetical protein
MLQGKMMCVRYLHFTPPSRVRSPFQRVTRLVSVLVDVLPYPCARWRSQIVAVQKYLPLHDWVLWMDCDSLFMNTDMLLEQVIVSALAAADTAADVHAILSSDGAMLNTGVMLFRRHPWTFTFLDEVYSVGNGTFINHPWWEQAAMHYLLNDAPSWRQRRAHTQFVPQRWMNRYGKPAVTVPTRTHIHAHMHSHLDSHPHTRTSTHVLHTTQAHAHPLDSLLGGA